MQVERMDGVNEAAREKEIVRRWEKTEKKATHPKTTRDRCRVPATGVLDLRCHMVGVVKLLQFAEVR